MREIRNLINELQEYIEQIENYVFKNNKQQYSSIHNTLTNISDTLMDIDFSLISINTPDKINRTIKILEEKRIEIEELLIDKNIKLQVSDEYDEMIKTIDEGNSTNSKLNITEEQIDNLLSKLNDSSYFKEQINNLPTATASEIPGLSANNKLTADVRL